MAENKSGSSSAQKTDAAPSASSARSSEARRSSWLDAMTKTIADAMAIPEVAAAARKTAETNDPAERHVAIVVDGRQYVLCRGLLVGLAPQQAMPSPEAR